MKYVDDFLNYLMVVRKHSTNTVINYKVDLEDFYNFMKGKLLHVKKDDVNRYLEHLYKMDTSKSTIARRLSSLRQFYNYLIKEGIVENNYFNLIKSPKKDRSLPKYVPDDAVDKMFLIPDVRKPLGQRNLLILRMLYATGIRVSELVNIRLGDIDIDARTIRIMGKGSKERIVVFGNNAQDILVTYLSNGRTVLDTKSSDYLFLNKDGFGLSSRYVRKIIDDVIIKAGISMHVSPHMLRHTFATDMLNNGADLVSVRDLLGHESLNTTSIYTHLSDEKIREVYNMAHPKAH